MALRSSSHLRMDRVPSAGPGSPAITPGQTNLAGRQTAARSISFHGGPPRTRFDSPSLVILPDITTTEIDVSSRHAVLPMQTVRGSIWMLDNVDK